MNVSHSDALVFFGATGDLAHKKIFPSLQAMIKRGHLNVPVIGVAKAGWNVGSKAFKAEGSAAGAGNLFGSGDVGVVGGSGVEGGGGGNGKAGLGRGTKGDGTGGGGLTGRAWHAVW